MIEYTVFFGLVTAWRFAVSPTLRSPFYVNATIDGVVRLPSLLAITTLSFPSKTATHEFVVPRSIPIIFPIVVLFFLLLFVISLIIVSDCLLSVSIGFAYSIANSVPRVKGAFFNVK